MRLPNALRRSAIGVSPCDVEAPEHHVQRVNGLLENGQSALGVLDLGLDGAACLVDVGHVLSLG